MKISILMENTACSDSFCSEHGLSIYIEACGHKLLFDTGASGAFADNAEKMGIDLAGVDTAVLSHGHYDHGGGLRRFLEINSRAEICMNPHAFEGHYNGSGKYIGLDQELKDSGRLVFADRACSLFDAERSAGDGAGEGLCCPGSEGTGPACGSAVLYPSGGYELKYPVDSSGLTVERGGSFIPEDFIHEQYLLIEENNKRVLISGCSHRGILNIMNRFSPDVLIGGFHFMEIPAEGGGAARLEQAARELMQYETQYFTGHCTGLAQFGLLKQIMGDRLTYISTGMSFEI